MNPAPPPKKNKIKIGSQIDTQISIFIPVPLSLRYCLHLSDTYRETKHTPPHRARLQRKKSSPNGLTTHRKIREGTKTLLFSVWPDRAKTNFNLLSILITNTQDNTELNLKQISISNAYYTGSFRLLTNNTALISFSWRATLWCSHISASPHVSDPCFYASLLGAILVRVDSSSQRLLCVRTVSLERDLESAVGLWLCIKAGWASRWCRQETQLLQQLELLPGYISLADVSARLVHQAKLLFSPYTCVYILYISIKSDLFSLVTSYMFKMQSAHTEINTSSS